MLMRIDDLPIRRDTAGRWCLNDLHAAAVLGGANKRSTEPSKFFRSRKVKRLIRVLEDEFARGEKLTLIGPVKPVSVKEGRMGGTYAVVEVAIRYAMWASVKFRIGGLSTCDTPITSSLLQPQVQANDLSFARRMALAAAAIWKRFACWAAAPVR